MYRNEVYMEECSSPRVQFLDGSRVLKGEDIVTIV